VFAALVAACFAAFFATQRLKHTPTAVQNFRMTGHFTPGAHGRHRVVHLSFRIKQDDEVTVEIVNFAGEDVATLIRDRPLARYTQLSLVWDGHRGPTRRLVPGAGTSRDPLTPVDVGRLAPPGEYRLSVTLRHQGRTVFSPHTFVLRPSRSAR
jgi:hypothetical protein